MVMSEPRESNRNGKRSRGSSPSTNITNVSTKPANPPAANDLTPETSDDDSRKSSTFELSDSDKFTFRKIFSDSKKNLGKSKNGKSEFEGKSRTANALKSSSAVAHQ